MFNRVAQKEKETTHNIIGLMSRSRKRTPVSTICCCKSLKRGKQCCNRRFRRRERMLLRKNDIDGLPTRPMEIMDPWDLGGDGKCYWRIPPDSDIFKRMMRK